MAATGHPNSGNVNGVSFYKELTGFVDNPSNTYWDDKAKAAYFYDGTTFWSGENARSIQAKADYQHCTGLAGAMMYSLEALDPGTTLFNNVVNSVNSATAGCSTAPPTNSPSASPTGSANPSPTSGGGGSCTAPAWSASAVYTGGAVVSFNGRQYTAKWWTQGEQPDTHSRTDDVWRDNGPCSGGGPSPSMSPTGSPTTSPSASPTGAGQHPSWQANHAYAAGDLVSYAGHDYRCIQSHTSQTGWEPPNVPALWQALN